MGASQSTTVAPVQGVNKEVIRLAMRDVFDKFNSDCGKGLSQTELFKKIMTTKTEEFKAFDANNLGAVFTDRGKCFPELKGSYNNCFLFRDSQTGVFYIPLRSNGKYAKWEDIQEAILPVTSKFGFAVTHKTRVEADRVIVTCIVRHRDGHQDQTELPLPLDTSGSKNNVQAVGSSVSYGKRYTASALLGIRVDGDDDDGNKAQGKKPSKAKSRGLYADMQAELRQCMNMDALREWDETNKAKGFYEQLPDDWFYSLKEEYDTRKEMFE